MKLVIFCADVNEAVSIADAALGFVVRSQADLQTLVERLKADEDVTACLVPGTLTTGWNAPKDVRVLLSPKFVLDTERNMVMQACLRHSRHGEAWAQPTKI